METKRDKMVVKRNTLKARTKTFPFMIIKAKDSPRIGDSSGATSIPPITRGMLFFNSPARTIKIETISKK
jgi:hypothetical protein